MKTKVYTILLIILLPCLSNNTFSQNVSVIEFDGDDSFYVNDASNKLDVASDWTWEFYIYPTSSTIPASGFFPAVISRKYSLEVYLRQTTGGDLSIGVQAFSGSGSGFTYEAIFSNDNNQLVLNDWNHVAISYQSSSTTTRLFFNGIEVSSSTDPDFDLDASVAAYNIGARYDGSYLRYISGCALDEIRFSNVARYTANFSVDETSAPFSSDANTILLYHLDENSGTSLSCEGDADFNASLRSSPNTATWRGYDYYPSSLPLPVELSSFTSETTSENYCQLYWITNSEIYNQKFEIERSIDNNSWEKIGEVAGAGNSNIENMYNFIDLNSLNSAYYRLRQVDFDGKSSFSDVLFHQMESETSFSIFPNPATETIYIFDNNNNAIYYSIFSLSGDFVGEGKVTNNQININQLKTGFYVINFIDRRSKMISKTFVKR